MRKFQKDFEWFEKNAANGCEDCERFEKAFGNFKEKLLADVKRDKYLRKS